MLVQMDIRLSAASSRDTSADWKSTSAKPALSGRLGATGAGFVPNISAWVRLRFTGDPSTEPGKGA